MSEVERLQGVIREALSKLEAVEALHLPVPTFEQCPYKGCDEPVCFESTDDGMYLHRDKPAGHVCAICVTEEYEPVDYPCLTVRAIKGTSQ